MQSFDDKDNVVESKMFDQFTDAIKAADEQMSNINKVKHVRVGHFPKAGEILEVNGLRCSVVMANSKKKRFTLEML